jgi:hypothetical protein
MAVERKPDGSRDASTSPPDLFSRSALRFTTWISALALASLLVASAALADERGTSDDAKVLSEKAAEHMREVGPGKAVADFTDPNGGFVDRDLFVVVYDAGGKILCAAGVPSLVGRSALALKDVDGKEFAKEIMALGKSNGTGWVEYRMTNPSTKKIERKRSYLVQVDDYIVFVGAYRP